MGRGPGKRRLSCPRVGDPLTISVIVPSYRRPDLLARCLEGLAAQERGADEVLVVRRRDDDATAEVVRSRRGAVREVIVDEPGMLHAMHAGMAQARGDVIAFTDDDAVARPEWLAHILRHYQDPAVGAVGGRDVAHPARDQPSVPSTEVGRLTRWGKLVGNHDVGRGGPARVQILKGVNMSFRREALALPSSLRGQGAEVHSEVAASLWASARGWTLVYDPDAVVDHYLGPRFDNDQRGRPDAQATRDEAYNLVTTMLAVDRSRLRRRALFGVLLGDRASPGLGRAAVGLVRGERDAVAKLVPSVTGQVQGLADAVRGRLPEMLRPPDVG